MSGSFLLSQAGGETPEQEEQEEQQQEEQEEQQEQQQEQDLDEDLDDDVDASHLERFMRDRRRARSLPACLLNGVTGAHEGKRVKFADSMGLNLASVKHFSALEDPKIPNKVLSRHRSFPPPPHHLLGRGFRSGLDPDRLVACFPPPREPERRVRDLRVCLEKVSVTQSEVRGHILALTGCRDKEVGVRFSFNDWLSHVDAQAVLAPAQPPGPVGERFGFTVFTPPCRDPGSAVHFAVYLRSEEGEFWDNNDGQNYVLRYRGLPGTTNFVSAAFHAT